MSEIRDDSPLLEETIQLLKLSENPIRVLVVEDDELVRHQLSMLIGSAGFLVLSADSAASARSMLAEDYYHIVIIDRVLGDADGLHLCTEVRNMQLPGYVYILLLTSRDSAQDIIAGLEAGSDDYLSKKISEAELLARLRTARRIVALEQSLRDALAERTNAAATDVLTGAHNRRYFTKHMGREILRAKRFATPLSLLLLDIDHFKLINDKHGHAAGDEVLKQFTARIRGSLPREIDWCARLGGEEFVVVLPQTEVGGAYVVAERLRLDVSAKRFNIGTESIDVSVSIGVSALECLDFARELAADAFLEQADRYLYRSKLAGRNRVSGPDVTKIVRQ